MNWYADYVCYSKKSVKSKIMKSLYNICYWVMLLIVALAWVSILVLSSSFPSPVQTSVPDGLGYLRAHIILPSTLFPYAFMSLLLSIIFFGSMLLTSKLSIVSRYKNHIKRAIDFFWYCSGFTVLTLGLLSLSHQILDEQKNQVFTQIIYQQININTKLKNVKESCSLISKMDDLSFFNDRPSNVNAFHLICSAVMKYPNDVIEFSASTLDEISYYSDITKECETILKIELWRELLQEREELKAQDIVGLKSFYMPFVRDVFVFCKDIKALKNSGKIFQKFEEKTQELPSSTPLLTLIIIMSFFTGAKLVKVFM
jgi:hypothetical protein